MYLEQRIYKIKNRTFNFNIADEAQRKCIEIEQQKSIRKIYNYLLIPTDMIIFPKRNHEEFNLILGREDISKMIQNPKFENNGLIISSNFHKKIKKDFSTTFKKTDLIINQELTFDQYLDHKGWGIVLRDPKIEGMPKEIASDPFFKEHFGRLMWKKLDRDVLSDKAMSFYVQSHSSNNFDIARPFIFTDTRTEVNIYCDKYCSFKDESNMIELSKDLPKWVPEPKLKKMYESFQSYR